MMEEGVCFGCGEEELVNEHGFCLGCTGEEVEVSMHYSDDHRGEYTDLFLSEEV